MPEEVASDGCGWNHLFDLLLSRILTVPQGLNLLHLYHIHTNREGSKQPSRDRRRHCTNRSFISRSSGNSFYPAAVAHATTPKSKLRSPLSHPEINQLYLESGSPSKRGELLASLPL